jgi:hypothetical protein
MIGGSLLAAGEASAISCVSRQSPDTLIAGGRIGGKHVALLSAVGVFADYAIYPSAVIRNSARNVALFGPRLPELEAIAFGVGGPAEAAVVVVFDSVIDRCAGCA